MFTNCKNCGAPLRDGRCEYCGTEYKETDEFIEEIVFADDRELWRIKRGLGLSKLPVNPLESVETIQPISNIRGTVIRC